jgi:prolyl 4-hydroxylase
MNTIFIGQYFLEDVSICDKLISYHKNSADKCAGKTSNEVRIKEKLSTDVVLNENDEIFNIYAYQIQLIANKYVNDYPMSNGYKPFGLVEKINIQHYKPNEGFFAYHCERGGLQSSSRHLTWITYLNDVNDAGETEFLHQKLKIKPEKGLTIIFPVDWTFTHRGITSPTEEKYIATGWLSYIE